MRPSEIRNPKSEIPESLRSHPVVRNYTLFCMAALFLMVVCLSERGMEWWGVVPALIGCMSLVTHWVHGPPLVLFSLAGLMGMSGSYSRWGYFGWSRFQTPTLMDLVLCIAVLAYVLGHYRLLALVRNVFPPDPRLPAGDSSQRRSVTLVTGRELAFLGLAFPVWPGLAVVIWAWMMDEETPLSLTPEVWRMLRLVWAWLAVLAVVGIATSYLRQASATPEESLMFLQDQCWRQTRREQSNLNRWLTWARVRAQRKKESS
ncbi:MAG TPA: hypothetical protein VH592_06780 [Gemmataceae bacterium]|jgi:hypothetical protein